MIRKLALMMWVVVLALSVHSVYAQSTQQVEVLLYHGAEEKTPLEGVSISAVGASSAMSDAQGLLTLTFRTLKTGEQIQFRRIDLAGYEVMNTEAIVVMRIGAGVATIVMCNTDELNQLRDGYHSAAAQHYQQQLEEAQGKIEALKQEGKLREEEYNRRMDELEANFEQQMQTLDTYVDKFARIDLSELDAYEQEIIALVQQGRFDEAIARYDDQHLTERLQQGVREQQQLQRDKAVIDQAIDAKKTESERLEQNLNQQIELLRKVGGEENERKADELQRAKQP